MKTASCLSYSQLDVACAFERDEGTESEVAMGVHPATYGTTYFGRHRAVLPPINGDIAEDDLFGGVEDRLIAAIDGENDEDASEDDGLADVTADDLPIEAAEIQLLADRPEDQDLPRRDKLVLQQYDFNQQARGDAYAAKKGQTPAQDKSRTFSLPATAVTPKAEKVHRLIGVRKEREIAAPPAASARPDTPRVTNHQAPKVPKPFLRLADARRIR